MNGGWPHHVPEEDAGFDVSYRALSSSDESMQCGSDLN